MSPTPDFPDFLLLTYSGVFVLVCGLLYFFARNRPETPSRRPHLKIRNATQEITWTQYKRTRTNKYVKT